MKVNDSLLPTDRIHTLVAIIRGQKVLLDRDLAVLYGVDTKALNQAVRRKLNRFPVDFMFRLTTDEVVELNRSQFVTGSVEASRSPISTLRLQRARRGDVVQRSAQQESCNRQHRDYAGVRATPGDAYFKPGTCAKGERNRTSLRQH